jgi:hypothetical protein
MKDFHGVRAGDAHACSLTSSIGKASLKYLGTDLNTVKVIFFGGDYGRDDTYVTPLGVKPGVTVHAYTYFSIGNPLRSLRWSAWAFDILLGLGSGLLFHGIWHQFHHSRRRNRFAPQVGWVTLNFGILGVILIGLVRTVVPLLERGLWINPALIVIGLFIDSYIATATATGKGSSDHTLPLKGSTSPSYPSFGMTSHDVEEVSAVTIPGGEDPGGFLPLRNSAFPLYWLFGVPGKHVLGRDLFFHGALRIIAF